MSKVKFHDLLAGLGSREEFLRLHPGPALLIEPYQDSGAVFETPAGGQQSKWKISATVLQDELPVVRANELVHEEARVVWLTPAGQAARTVSIGRAAECQIVVQHPTLSKQHGVLVPRGDGWRLADQGSTNGTFVNGVRLEPGALARLQDGTSVRLGVAITVHFLEAERLYELCKMVRGASGEGESPTLPGS